MLMLISARRAHGILRKHSSWIDEVSARYGVPAAATRAILFWEMTHIDVADPLVDIVVTIGRFPKKDSSTGYGQIFGYVALNAINEAVDTGLCTYGSLGISADHRLSPQSPEDVKTVWKKLHRNMRFNIEVVVLNVLSCAREMTGTTDFSSLDDDQMKLVFSRYNANTRCITPYGEQVFTLYRAFLEDEGA